MKDEQTGAIEHYWGEGESKRNISVVLLNTLRGVVRKCYCFVTLVPISMYR